MRTKIEVTSAHIRHGKRKQCKHCPIALAVDAHLNREHYCSVGPGSFISIDRKGGMAPVSIKSMPSVVEDFVNQFDIGWKVKPISFELDLPAESLIAL